MAAGVAMAQIEISSKEDLAKIGNDESYPLNGSYVLTADITLTGNWVSIGKPLSDSDEDLEDKSFTGTFDGGGHTISNLNITINEEKDVTYVGLFGRIGTDGIVKDLTIDGGTLKVNDNSTDDPSCNIGSIAGVNHGIISNCTSNATINCYAPATDGGGIAGENGGIIENCTFTGSVSTTTDTDGLDLHGNVFRGGITGDNETNGVIKNCRVEATIPNPKLKHVIYGQQMGGTTRDCYCIKNGNAQLVGRTFYKDENWNTLCLPFDVKATDIDVEHPLYLATIKELKTDVIEDGKNKTRVEGNTLYLHFVDAPTIGTTITAGKPYLVKWTTTGSSLVDPTFPGVSSFSSTDPKDVSVTSTDGNVTFIGTYFSKDIGAGGDNTILYVGAGNTLYYPNAAMSIGALRAYFQLNNYYYAAEPSSGGIKAFDLDFGEESTGVKEIFDTPKTKVQGWYDLSGRKVDGQHLQRGLYMKDGKKVLK